MTSVDALREWASKRNPEHPEFGEHIYDARCPWCDDSRHELAGSVLDDLRIANEATAELLRRAVEAERHAEEMRVQGMVWKNELDRLRASQPRQPTWTCSTCGAIKVNSRCYWCKP